jgi:STE24 endopeptidase
MRTIAGAFCAVLLLLAGSFGAESAMAQPAAAPTAKVQVQPLNGLGAPSPAAQFDAEKATDAYLATIKGQARKNSDAYFEGGYVLLLVDALYTIAVAALLLWLGVSAWMRGIAERITRSRFWQVPIYVILFLIVFTVAEFPLAVYEGFIREHAYGLSNMSFAQWLGDFFKGFGLQLVFGTIVLTLIYAAVRRTGPRWWIWGWLIAMVFVVIALVVAPVYIAPIFNDYYPLKEGPVKTEILSLARSNGIPVDNVYEFNASRQSKRISANVSGLFGTTRISMTDNLINRSTPQEIYAVLGHEMGHYVLDHVINGVISFGIVFLILFAFVNWGYHRLTARFGRDWGVRDLGDPAGLPIAMALVTFFLFIATPVTNTIIRSQEAQADIFGLNTARQPDGFAKATLQLSEYRKLDPSPLEEFVFYDHPSGRSRIFMSMRWKAQHVNDPDIKAGPVSPQ